MKTNTEDERYWREHHRKQPFGKPGHTYDHYAQAYRTGYEGFHKHPDKKSRRSKPISRVITRSINRFFRGKTPKMPRVSPGTNWPV